jgi:hypothetical protein
MLRAVILGGFEHAQRASVIIIVITGQTIMGVMHVYTCDFPPRSFVMTAADAAYQWCKKENLKRPFFPSTAPNIRWLQGIYNAAQ